MSVVVAEHAAPFAAVFARGNAKVETDAPGIDDDIRRIVERYLPQAEVDEYIARWSGLRTIVRIAPRHVRSWARGF